MQKGNVDMSKMKLIYMSDGHREMNAACDIKKDETVITVP